MGLIYQPAGPRHEYEAPAGKIWEAPKGRLTRQAAERRRSSCRSQPAMRFQLAKVRSTTSSYLLLISRE